MSDSETSSSPDRSRSPSSKASESPEEQYTRLRRYQKERNEAVRATKHAKRQLADVTNTRPEKRAKKSKKSSDGTASETEKELRLLARKFTLMTMPWIRNMEATFSTPPSEDYVPLDRFDNIENIIQGQVSDILDVLPTKYHTDWALNGTTWFKLYFREEMTQQRSNMSHRLRQDVGKYVFICTEDDMASPERRKELFSCIIGLPRPGEVYDCMNIPVLHKDYEGRCDVNKIFLNDALFEIFSSLAYGVGSVRKLRQGSSPITSGTVIAKWGVHHITPGAIATCAILARWTASPDEELQPHGLLSGISWHDDFERYLKYLNKGLLNRTRAILNIFAVWDSIFFKDTVSSLGGGTVGVEEAFNDAMAELEGAERVEDEEEEVAGEAGI